MATPHTLVNAADPRAARLSVVRAIAAIAALTLLAAWFAPSATADDATLAPHDVRELAEAGRFDDLAARLAPHAAPGGTAAAFLSHYQTFQRNGENRAAQRQEAYVESLGEVARNLATQNTEDAMVSAIEAHGLATDRDALADEHTVREALARATKEAQEAADAGEWVRASNLYRLLDLFYEDERRYEAQLEAANRSLRILQLYAPRHLQALYEAEAQRRAEVKGEDEPEPINLEVEPWQDRLESVSLTMLHSTLLQANRQHIEKARDGRTYRQLLIGGLNNLVSLVESEPLRETFESLNNDDQRQAFHADLLAITDELAEPGGKMDYLAAVSTIDRVLNRNAKTLALPEAVVTYELTEGVTGELDDFSSVIWPADIPAFLRTTQGKFTGIGVQISKRQGELIVVSPLEDTPAHRAGIKADDVIATVDGVSTANWSLTKAVDRITGDAGTDVTLEIKRRGETSPIEFVITRAPIPIESVRGWEHLDEGGWNYFIDPVDRIGYVRISAFLPQTVEDLDAAVAQMQETGPVHGLIIDLRFNPGGLLSAAVDISDRFLSDGLIVATVNAENEKTNEAKAKRHTTYRHFPVVCLINQGSASASEIVSGALQDYGRAIVVGATSFGKGSVQDLYPLSRGRAYLKLTTHYYQLPSGKIIHRTDDAEDWGVHPDIEVEVTDAQVRDAIEFRQLIDVVRAPGEGILADIEKPWAAEEFREPGGRREVQGKRADGTDRTMVEVRKPVPQELLDLGLDAQLEAALLVLKANRLAIDMAVAEASSVKGQARGDDG